MNDLVPYSDLERMAQTVVNSRLFPVKTPQEAITLFLVAQAEGLHPMTAMRRYDVIQGKPAMKTDAMLAGFFSRGGKIEWHTLSDSEADATFTSTGVPTGVRIKWTLSDARRAGLASKDTWTKYPRQMLRSRVVREGINATDPIVNQGMYTPEEVQDMVPEKPVRADAEILASPGQDVEQKPLGEVLEAAARRRAEAVLEYAPERFDEKNAKALGGLPKCCTAEGCPGTIGEFESEAKSMMGRRYFMCVLAFDERKRLLKAGYTNAKANAAVSKHYREWAEVWPREDKGAGDVVSEATTPSERASSTPALCFCGKTGCEPFTLPSGGYGTDHTKGTAPVAQGGDAHGPEPSGSSGRHVAGAASTAPHKEEWEEERARIVREVATKPGLSPAQRIDETGRRVNEALQRRLEEPKVKDKEEEREERQREAAIRDNF